MLSKCAGQTVVARYSPANGACSTRTVANTLHPPTREKMLERGHCHRPCTAAGPLVKSVPARTSLSHAPVLCTRDAYDMSLGECYLKLAIAITYSPQEWVVVPCVVTRRCSPSSDCRSEEKGKCVLNNSTSLEVVPRVRSGSIAFREKLLYPSKVPHAVSHHVSHPFMKRRTQDQTMEM